MKLKKDEWVELPDGSFSVYKTPDDNDYYQIYDNNSDDFIFLRKEKIIELRKLLNELNF